MAKKKINTLLIDGRIGRDAELRQAGNYRIAKFSICHNNSKKVDGEWQDDPLWLDCEYFMHDSDDINKFCKGAVVELNGALKEDKWEKDGVKRSKFKLAVNDVAFGEVSGKVDNTPDNGKGANYNWDKARGDNSNSTNSGHPAPFVDDVPWQEPKKPKVYQDDLDIPF